MAWAGRHGQKRTKEQTFGAIWIYSSLYWPGREGWELPKFGFRCLPTEGEGGWEGILNEERLIKMKTKKATKCILWDGLSGNPFGHLFPAPTSCPQSVLLFVPNLFRPHALVIKYFRCFKTQTLPICSSLSREAGWQEKERKYSKTILFDGERRKITEPPAADSKMMSLEAGLLHLVWLSQLRVRSSWQVSWSGTVKLECTHPAPPSQSHNSSFKFLYKFPPSKLCSSSLRRRNFFFLLSKKLGELSTLHRSTALLQNSSTKCAIGSFFLSRRLHFFLNLIGHMDLIWTYCKHCVTEFLCIFRLSKGLVST